MDKTGEDWDGLGLGKFEKRRPTFFKFMSVYCWRALARQHTILVIRGKIQNFVGCQTRSLRSRALSGIVETTIMRKSHG